MEHIWILYIFIYSFLKGSRDGMKKAALKRNSSTVILFFYTFTGLLFTLPFSKTAFSLAPHLVLVVFVKAAVVCTAWLFAYAALKNMSVSLFGIMDLSRMVFSTLLGVFWLGESLTIPKVIGMILVVLGLFLANLKKETQAKGVTVVVLLSALLNCLFNAISGTMDKVLMGYMDSAQLQFWFMFFMTVIYGILLIGRQEKIHFSTLKTNYWIPLMSLSLVVGDKLLFEANANPLSEVTYMTIIKQSSVLITVLSGWLVFHEKHILYKFMCTGIVLAGIFIAILL